VKRFLSKPLGTRVRECQSRRDRAVSLGKEKVEGHWYHFGQLGQLVTQMAAPPPGASKSSMARLNHPVAFWSPM
jgi:hypothetical protein